MAKLSTAGMVEWLRYDATPFLDTDRERLDEIAARLSAMDKELTAATARAEKAEALYAKAWEECEEWHDSANVVYDESGGAKRWFWWHDEEGWINMPAADAHDAARMEAGL